MQVLSKRTLKAFWERYPHARRPLESWYAIAESASWGSPTEIKVAFGTNVDFVADNRVIFDIGGNKYRLIVRVSYRFQRILIKFIGTHSEYDDIDPETVGSPPPAPQERRRVR
ncbi:MAG: type II toxin-antitoxin system HigB family toxin [Rhizobiales bacterium]|nr:type II toxin-antitoxin system HigB family toxin [Hyphomicrobiales bacterium]